MSVNNPGRACPLELRGPAAVRGRLGADPDRLWGGRAAKSTAAETAGSQADLQRFHAFLEGLFPLAAARGIDRATFDWPFAI